MANHSFVHICRSYFFMLSTYKDGPKGLQHLAAVYPVEIANITHGFCVEATWNLAKFQFPPLFRQRGELEDPVFANLPVEPAACETKPQEIEGQLGDKSFSINQNSLRNISAIIHIFYLVHLGSMT